jgi:hypothetical protein
LSPITRIAAISSRMVRDPSSAQIAAPPAPAITSVVTIGAACWTMASTLAAPVKDCAPSWVVRVPSWSAITAPSGIEIRIAGTQETLTTNQNCSSVSLARKGRRKRARSVSSASAKRLPVAFSERTGRLGRATERAWSDSSSSATYKGAPPEATRARCRSELGRAAPERGASCRGTTSMARAPLGIIPPPG